jgi:guanylate kinase
MAEHHHTELRIKVAEENQQYLSEHPELKSILNEYVHAVFAHKPSDLETFTSKFFSNFKVNEKIGPSPIIIVGPSGVGKGTLINKLLEVFPNTFGFSVSHTTRGPRNGEVDGVHYHFVSNTDFEEGVTRGHFVEHAKVHTNYYGTSFKAINNIRSQRKVCILDIDVQGHENVKKSGLDCKSVFVAPPSLQELETRLRDRGTEAEDKIKVRLANAVNELSYGHTPGNFDEILLNDNLDEAFEKLSSLLRNWYPEFL